LSPMKTRYDCEHDILYIEVGEDRKMEVFRPMPRAAWVHKRG
jgi:hypothetical protein